MKRMYELVEAGSSTGLCVRIADDATDEQIFAALQGAKWRGFRPWLAVGDARLDRFGFELVDETGQTVAELALVEEAA